MFGLRIIRAPTRGLLFRLGKPHRVLGPGVHYVPPILEKVVQVSTALHTDEVDIDVITRGGTPTSIKVGYTARVVDVEAAIVKLLTSTRGQRAVPPHQCDAGTDASSADHEGKGHEKPPIGPVSI